MPCHPARARELLNKKKAKIYRMQPFTIILLNRDDGKIQDTELKIDPGSKTTGISLVAKFKRGLQVVWACNLNHRGHKIKDSLDSRRAIRRSRRQRNTRYRKPRFDNRRRPDGWLPPSLQSRVDNVVHISKKLTKFTPVSSIAVETVRFDTQKMQNPEISGCEYQQGELFGYEVREYLLEKWGRQCAYCGKSEIPLEVEHIIPKSKGGSNRVDNLTLACTRCNIKKGSQDLEKFLKDKNKIKMLKSKAKNSLRDTASVNSTRHAIGTSLKQLQVPISFWSGGRTKHNRIKQSYKKDHWIDAACVGENGVNVIISLKHQPLLIEACGRGSRQQCRVDAYGFPRTSPKSKKLVFGFQTGDLVIAKVPSGKQKGIHLGRVAVRSTGNFNIKTMDKMVQGINHRFCKSIQRIDGYMYSICRTAPPLPEERGIRRSG
jgi:5-methylcytosine-specific restriction endonuclease McrA